MCEICGQIPCHPRCPNAEEPDGKCTCIKCGYGIMEDDEYLETAEGPVCMECLDDMSTRELIEICGEQLQKA
ncbi:hypothetical protein NSB25_11540 [Acetatifactor muris]|uniref:Uncharacterized protein n=1 Tax=Acetatifactor muris TaxID=879566 RepID=A0A2K4ZGX3_9FIRM|nr:hypothetical protein [Acetatifactor muris]MCR2047918.1 hypothetical protein [Acetatifactor muris]SOY29720.1 hypothetical protein AMURIS_02441 [Acetatifactor muris]